MMRKLLATASMLALLAAPGFASAQDAAQPDPAAQDEPTEPAPEAAADEPSEHSPLVETGGEMVVTVSSVDPAGQSFEIATGETVLLGEGVSIDELQPGDEVRISYEGHLGTWTATSIEPVEPGTQGAAPGAMTPPATGTD